MLQSSKKYPQTLVSAGGVDKEPVIQCKELKEGQYGAENASEPLWVCLAECLTEYHTEHELDQEH